MQVSFKMGEWRVDPNTNRLVSTRVPDQQIRIDPKAMQVLVYLAEHAGEVVRKKQVVLVSVDPRRSVELSRATGEGVDSSTIARRIARQLGAELYAQGDVAEVDGQLHLRALLYPVDDHSGPVARASVQGNTAELFQMVKQLTSRLLASQHQHA